MRRTGLSPRVATALIAVTLAAATSCGGDGGQTEPASETPRITTDVWSQERLQDRLLRTEDVRSALGVEPGPAVPLDQAAVFENPDPRGPCGAVVPPPPGLSVAAGTSFQAQGFTLVELLSAPSEDEVRGYLDAVQGDLRTDCPAFESTTNQGLQQRVSGVRAIETSGVGDRSVAWTTFVEVKTQRLHAALAAVQAGPLFAFVQVFSAERMPGSTLRRLAEAAALRLR